MLPVWSRVPRSCGNQGTILIPVNYRFRLSTCLHATSIARTCQKEHIFSHIFCALKSFSKYFWLPFVYAWQSLCIMQWVRECQSNKLHVKHLFLIFFFRRMTFITVQMGMGRAARTHLFRLINKQNGPISTYNCLLSRSMINRTKLRKNPA